MVTPVSKGAAPWVCALALVALAGVSRARAQDTWTTPHPGMRLLLRRASGPRRIHALAVDLCAAGVSVRTTTEAEKGQTPSSFGTAVGAQAAVNGDFFNTTTYVPTGFAMGEGTVWHGDGTLEGYVAFGPDRAVISPPEEVLSTPPAWMRQAVGGRPQLVRGGTALSGIASPSHCTALNPRTAVGLSRDRDTLYLVVVDGRSTSSIGMTCDQLATLMRGLGAWDALMLDGGGSSDMWVAGVGVVGAPSDGVERRVGDHIAVLATGSGAPGSCDRSVSEATDQAVSDPASGTTDVDGDGRADACARGAAGFECWLGAPDGLSTRVTGPELSDMLGWGDPTNWQTIRMADLDGDGRSDVVARANAGIRYWLSTGDGYGASLVGPDLSDTGNWNQVQYYSTIRLADIDGDGLADLCARFGVGFRCYPSTPSGFGDQIPGPDLSDAAGWDVPSRYGTIRMGDVDGDGRADVCARDADGMHCWLSTGTALTTEIDGPAWTDADGWDDVSHWSTIRLADVDGDGRADLCGRSATDFRCHLSTGDGFGPAVLGPDLADGSGWADYGTYATIRMGDVDGDGTADVCARGHAGVRCYLWDGASHATAIDGPPLSDADGWDAPEYFRTIRLADVDGDGRDDLCARGPDGLSCWLSTGTGFSAAIPGPAWADAVGWSAPKYYDTTRIAGLACANRAEQCNGRDDDCDGVVDEGCAGPDAGVIDGGGPGFDAGTAIGDDAGGPAGGGGSGGGCGCTVPGRTGRGSGRGAWLVLLLVLGLVTRATARARRRSAAGCCRRSR